LKSENSNDRKKTRLRWETKRIDPKDSLSAIKTTQRVVQANQRGSRSVKNRGSIVRYVGGEQKESAKTARSLGKEELDNTEIGPRIRNTENTDQKGVIRLTQRSEDGI